MGVEEGFATSNQGSHRPVQPHGHRSPHVRRLPGMRPMAGLTYRSIDQIAGRGDGAAVGEEMHLNARRMSSSARLCSATRVGSMRQQRRRVAHHARAVCGGGGTEGGYDGQRPIGQPVEVMTAAPGGGRAAGGGMVDVGSPPVRLGPSPDERMLPSTASVVCGWSVYPSVPPCVAPSVDRKPSRPVQSISP